jgi:hypothetical protein
MDHQRQSGLARGGGVDAEHLGLDVARAQVVVEIEAALADAHHPRVGGHAHQGGGVEVGGLLSLVRMGADRAPDVRLVGQGAHGRIVGHPVADVDHQGDAGGAGAGDDRRAVRVELRRMQVDVAVDQHRVRPRRAAVPKAP